MENDDLAKKLENISLPEIELPNHRTKLRLLLMEKYAPEKKRREFFSVLNKLIPATAFVIILLFIFLGKGKLLVDNIARAKEIALQNAEIKNWVDEGAIIKDVQLIDSKAYVLIEPTETGASKTIAAPQESQATDSFKSGGAAPENLMAEESFKGAVAEIDIKEKKISNIEKLALTFTNLIKKSQERVLEIADESPQIQEIVPKEAKVSDINVPVPKFKLIKEGDKISVITETNAEERASIIYQSDSKKWEGKIDLNKQRVEEVKFMDEE